MIQPTDIIGDCTLYRGDCREVLPWLSTVDAVVTDPPYGLGRRLAGGTWGAKVGGGLEWDQETPKDLKRFVDLSKVAVIWGGNYFSLPPTRCMLVWWKPDAVRTMADAEVAWTNLDANTRVLRHSIAATNAERNGHPTQKPLRVMRWSVDQLKLPPGATILDPFMGSGTTGVAALGMGFRFIGIELDPTHYETARKRLLHATGEGPGQLFAPNLLEV